MCKRLVQDNFLFQAQKLHTNHKPRGGVDRAGQPPPPRS